VKQKAHFIRIKSCPVCEASEFSDYMETSDHFLTKEYFSLVKCNACGFVFTNPIPDLKDLSSYYDSPDYLSHKVDAFSVKGFLYDRIRDFNIRKKYNLVKRFSGGGKILDIGQGTGELLAYFSKKGWEVTGIEPNKSAREFAQKKYNLSVFDEAELDSLNASSFDAITLWHVIEHVPELKGRMEQIRKLLKKDGYLFIAVPMLDSPDALKYGKYWAALDVPRHLYHFTQHTMNELLTQNGFKLISSVPMKFDAFYVSLLSEQYKGNKLPYVSAFLNGLESNRKTRKTNNYSSMIFVAQQQ
jgi:SAM-dependent methyltransferase